VICLCVVAWCSYPQTLDQWHTFLAAIVKHPSSEHFVAPQLDALPRNGDEWVVLANQNVESGGPVWLVFSVYYGGTGK